MWYKICTDTHFICIYKNRIYDISTGISRSFAAFSVSSMITILKRIAFLDGWFRNFDTECINIILVHLNIFIDGLFFGTFIFKSYTLSLSLSFLYVHLSMSTFINKNCNYKISLSLNFFLVICVHIIWILTIPALTWRVQEIIV